MNKQTKQKKNSLQYNKDYKADLIWDKQNNEDKDTKI